MKFGLNYSKAAIQCYEEGSIAPDVFKCPAWPDLIAQVKDRYPIYIHFPLQVGWGQGDARDGETKQPADWAKIERLLAESNTPYVNLHLLSSVDFGPVGAAIDPYHRQQTIEALIKDVEAVIQRFGKEKVIVENGFDLGDQPIAVAYDPDVIHQVVASTGCGFLFDLSHARIAAMRRERDYRHDIARLPMHALREIHITGIQEVNDYWINRARASGLSDEILEQYMGPGGAWLPQGKTDHLPLSEEDWPVMTWAAQQLRSGAWREPWVISLECGGVGPFWEATFTADEIREQVPRLQAIFA